ncbi:MAG: hypothetical protein AB7U73_17595 [Pirellulales bacterium]
MRRTIWTLLALVFSATWIGQAHAFEWLDRVCCAVKSEYLRIKLWPEPWIEPDRVATRAPFVVQIANGWRAHNTLGPQHFDPETGQLTHAGQLKVADIMQISPAPHRKIYIERADTPERTAERVASAQEYSASIAYDTPAPPVFVSNSRQDTMPAEYIDTIQRRFQETTPEPRLPEGEVGEDSSATSAGT